MDLYVYFLFYSFFVGCVALVAFYFLFFMPRESRRWSWKKEPCVHLQSLVWYLHTVINCNVCSRFFCCRASSLLLLTVAVNCSQWHGYHYYDALHKHGAWTRSNFPFLSARCCCMHHLEMSLSLSPSLSTPLPLYLYLSPSLFLFFNEPSISNPVCMMRRYKLHHARDCTVHWSFSCI